MITTRWRSVATATTLGLAGLALGSAVTVQLMTEDAALPDHSSISVEQVADALYTECTADRVEDCHSNGATPDLSIVYIDGHSFADVLISK